MQDVPFGVVNSIFLVGTVNDNLSLGRQCSSGSSDNTGFPAVKLCILLSSIASLMYKVTKLRTFPHVWQEYERLCVVKAELEERATRLQISENQTRGDISSESDEEEDESKLARTAEVASIINTDSAMHTATAAEVAASAMFGARGRSEGKPEFVRGLHSSEMTIPTRAGDPAL
jgi:hypothetical protein